MYKSDGFEDIEEGGVMILNIVIYVVPINFFLFNNPHLFNFFFQKVL